MKKYLIQLSEFGEFQFRLPLLTGRKSEILSKILLSLGVLSLFTYLLIFSLSTFFTGNSIEKSVFDSLLFFLALTLGFFGSLIVLQGKKVLVDPNYFLSVLFFALLTTATSVLKSPAHISNTFGIDILRSFAGISVMAFVGFYYFTNFIIRDLVMLKRMFRVVIVGFCLLIPLVLIHTNLSDVNYVNSNLSSVMIVYSILLLVLLTNRKRKLIKGSVLAVSAIFVFLTPQTLPDSILSTRTIVMLVSAFLIVGFIYAFFKRSFIRSKFRLIRNLNIKNQKYSITEFSYFLLLTVSLLAILVGVLVHFRFNFNFSILSNPINIFLSEINSTITNGVKFQSLMVGTGTYDAIRRVSNLDASVSSITNIFITQGALGLIAYLFILITGLQALIRSIIKSLKFKNSRGLIFVLSFIMIYVIINSLFIYGGIFETVLWWFSFSLFAIYLKIDDLKDLFLISNWKVEAFLLKNKLGIYLRVLLSLLVLLFAIFTLVSITRITI